MCVCIYVCVYVYVYVYDFNFWILKLPWLENPEVLSQEPLAIVAEMPFSPLYLCHSPCCSQPALYPAFFSQSSTSNWSSQSQTFSNPFLLWPSSHISGWHLPLTPGVLSAVYSFCHLLACPHHIEWPFLVKLSCHLYFNGFHDPRLHLRMNPRRPEAGFQCQQ